MRSSIIIVALFALAACGTQEPGTPLAARSAVLLAPQTCTTTDDCGEDEICAGADGCEIAWTCQPAPKACFLIATEQCTCDGATVWGDRACIGVPIAHGGSCD